MYLYMALKWLKQASREDARLPPAPRLKNVIGR